MRRPTRVSLSVTLLVTFVWSSAIPVLAQGQGVPPFSPRSFSNLRAAVASRSMPTAEELQIRWTPYPGALGSTVVPGSRPAAGEFQVLVQRPVPGTLPRERNPQLSVDQLVAVAIDTARREVDWQILRDPRVIRAETAGPDGRLTGQVLHRTETEFLITLPGGMRISEIRLYKPVWTGTEFILEPIGSVVLTNSATPR